MGIAERLVGSWDLVSFEYQLPNGQKLYTYGSRPAGLLVYTSTGHMSVQVMSPERPRFASGDRRRGTLEEFIAAMDGYVAYFGTFEVLETEAIVIHRVAGDIFPNAAGTVQRRSFELSGDLLILGVPPFMISGQRVTGRVVWRRLGMGPGEVPV